MKAVKGRESYPCGRNRFVHPLHHVDVNVIMLVQRLVPLLHFLVDLEELVWLGECEVYF